ncbi:MAG: LPS translocon maturation chaperone LptM [Bacteroidales bacterium]
MRRLTTLVVIAAMALSLSACGRKGKPIPPDGSTYPRPYPNVEFPQQPPQGRSGSENQAQ